MRRMVIKVGTSTLTGGTRKLSGARMVELARQISSLFEQGWAPVLVSSGAIAAGREALGHPDLPRHIPKKQMLAAIGQPRLMGMYEQFFGIFERQVAQVLLTRADLTDRKRYLNARGTLEALLSQGVLPIVNENDTVATEEIRFGDNDNLSARVASLIEADLLLLLTDQEGLYTDDPRSNPEAALIEEVPAEELTGALVEAAGGSKSGLGTGGMSTKLQAADLARRGGTEVLIARGDRPGVVLAAAQGERLGTHFAPLGDRLEARKRFMLAGGRAAGQLRVDGGAARALARGGSLLPAGIVSVTGDFERGDVVEIIGVGGKRVAIGMSNYPARDLVLAAGKRSAELESLLGYSFGEEAVHRNNMVVLGRKEGE